MMRMRQYNSVLWVYQTTLGCLVGMGGERMLPEAGDIWEWQGMQALGPGDVGTTRKGKEKNHALHSSGHPKMGGEHYFQIINYSHVNE